MYLIPLPRKVSPRTGVFSIDHQTDIVLDIRQGDTDFRTAVFLRDEIEKVIDVTLPVKKDWQSEKNSKYHSISFEYPADVLCEEAYRLEIAEEGIAIRASSGRGFLYGAATLIQLCKLYKGEIPCMEIDDEPSFPNRGYLLDVSRGRVPTMDTLRNLVDKLALYKINQLQLYVEDSFLLDGFEEIWSQTDPLISEEILELDRYCSIRGIELIPCIATFGHLYNLLSSESFGQYREIPEDPGEVFTWHNRMIYHTINVSDPQSVDLIIGILDQYISLFRSNKVNICCDETFDLGKGKSAEQARAHSKGSLYVAYVNKLVGFLQSVGREVMIWGDMLLEHQESVGELYVDVTVLNWNYDNGRFENKVRFFRDAGMKQYVCPSVAGHSRLVNAYGLSFVNIQEMAELGCKYGAEGFLNTEWGDSGHINMPSLSVPCMIYGAAKSWNVQDKREFRQIDEVISLIEYADPGRSITGLLRDLADQDIISFGKLVFFRDQKVLGQTYRSKDGWMHEIARKIIMKAPELCLKEAVVRCEEILKGLKRNPSACRTEMRREIGELYLSARGVGLMQEVALMLKKYEYGQNVTPLTSAADLAGRLEYWLMDYCAAWRFVSRESELYRIKEFIRQICTILRQYERTVRTPTEKGSPE